MISSSQFETIYILVEIKIDISIMFLTAMAIGIKGINYINYNEIIKIMKKN